MKTMGVASTALVLPGCGTLNAPKEKPNILWITCEDIGPALGCYGDEYADTPNLDTLASEGILYRNAFATAPICAPARSCLITGLYATSLGTQHLRSDIPVPADLKILPQYLRDVGYYCTNNSKTDYNFSPEGRWDENSSTAHWRNRPDGQPFFSVFNYGMTHEGNANSSDEKILAGLEKRHDPAKAVLPPYYPDTPEMRSIWARQYDLISVWDKQIGEFIRQLEEDGLLDDTIIFAFSDHGYGLPRYKRWLYNTGLQVPFIVRIPDKYKHLVKTNPGEENDELVSFVDFAPSVLQLAGLPAPEIMEGLPFLGRKIPKPRTYIYGARSRADDAFDVSRAIRDKRYIYIRNFMPHLPYIQDALIFGDQKRTFKELRRVRNSSGLPPAGEAMWVPKPVEELYDLQDDPFELNNLAGSPQHQNIKQQLRDKLFDWILEKRDTGFLIEAEMMIRAEKSSVYEMAHDPAKYDIKRILDTAGLVGDTTVPLDDVTGRLDDADSGVRFWAATAILAMGDRAKPAVPVLIRHLTDNSPSVQIVCAECLCKLDSCEGALAVLSQNFEDERPWVVLQAASSTRNIGVKAKPILSQIRKIQKKNSGNVWGRYKNWLYPMFIGFALDKALINCGEKIEIREK